MKKSFQIPLFALILWLGGAGSLVGESTVATAVGLSNLSSTAQDILKIWAMGDVSQATKKADKWLSNNKKESEPWLVLSFIYYQEGRYRKSLKYAKKAIKRGPQSAEAYFLKGRAYEKLNKPLEAANEYQAALIARREYPVAQERLDAVLAQLNRMGETPE